MPSMASSDGFLPFTVPDQPSTVLYGLPRALAISALDMPSAFLRIWNRKLRLKYLSFGASSLI